MESGFPDLDISYQNKDIISKLFGDRMKGKPLSLFGLESRLKVIDTKPTNLPVVWAKELRMNSLFELEDGSIAIIDYESDYKETRKKDVKREFKYSRGCYFEEAAREIPYDVRRRI